MIAILSKAYQVNGVAYATLEQAQQAELALLVPGDAGFATAVMQNKARVMDILTTSKTSRPKRRKINKVAAQETTV